MSCVFDGLFLFLSLEAEVGREVGRDFDGDFTIVLIMWMGFVFDIHGRAGR